MLDQNTDRMWYVIGAVLIGGLIIASSVILFSDTVFAGVEDSYVKLMAIGYEDEVPEGYTLVTDDDFEWVESSRKDAYYAENEEGKGYYHYVGGDEYVMIPYKINGHIVRNTLFMFRGISSNLKGVAMGSPFVKNAYYLFYQTKLETLSLDHFDVSNLRSIHGLFERSQFEFLDLSSFDTSNINRMGVVFLGAKIGHVNLEGWDVAKVTSFAGFLRLARIDELDLSSFNFPTDDNVEYKGFFQDTRVNTVYVGSEDDVGVLKQDITLIPDGLTISIKD